MVKPLQSKLRITTAILSAIQRFGFYGIWVSSCKKGTYCICKQWSLRGACASAQSPQSLHWLLTWCRVLEEASDKKSRRFEPCHEIWHFSSSVNSFFNPVCLDVWFLIGPLDYFHTSILQTAKALARVFRATKRTTLSFSFLMRLLILLP